MDLIQTVPMPNPAQTTSIAYAPAKAPEKVSAPALTETKADKVELSSESEKKEPPQIGRWRLFFNRLTQEQINQVNETRMLPGNAKFEKGFNYHVANNWCNVFEGTPVLPAGYELKRGLLGFTKVRPIGTKGLLIRKTPEEKAAKIEAKALKAQAKAEAKAEKQAAKQAEPTK